MTRELAMPSLKRTTTGKSTTTAKGGTGLVAKRHAASVLTQSVKIKSGSASSLRKSVVTPEAQPEMIRRKDFRQAAVEAAERYKGSMQILS